jgi:uncharacterized protein GlcG (DUF336 family)
MYSKQVLSLEDARIVGEAALAKAMENPDRPMAIAVGDVNGELVYFVKMGDPIPLCSRMAINKMYTATQFRMDTVKIKELLTGDKKTLSDFPDPRFTTVEGGVCLKAPDGAVIGAIGTSGRVPTIDKVNDLDVALAGAKALSF